MPEIRERGSRKLVIMPDGRTGPPRPRVDSALVKAWRPLFTWLRTHLHDQLQKQIARLEEKTGTRWEFPTGDPPDWLPDEEG